jgi:hypothetical protein
MKSTHVLRVFVLMLIVASTARAQHHLAAAEARTHIGETATVCGEVVSTRYASSTKGRPTFLNLDKPYPGQIFTIVMRHGPHQRVSRGTGGRRDGAGTVEGGGK